MKRKTTILIADDHSIMRMGLKSMLNVQPDMSVVGEAANGQQAVELAETLKPDVVIMDLMMPELDGADATRRIVAANPAAKVIILTSFGNDTAVLRAVRNGASGIQLKEDDEDLLLGTIRKTVQGDICIPNDLLQRARSPEDTPALTRKQSEILHYVSRGLTNKDIARLFGITEVGVQKHLKLIFAKVGAANRSEAVTIALRKHLLKI